MLARPSCLPLLLLLLGGCARRLPGPAECRAFALAAIGVDPRTPAAELAEHSRMTLRAEELTRECLTTPWDYQLLNCLQNGGSTRLCTARFEARRAASPRPRFKLPGE